MKQLAQNLALIAGSVVFTVLVAEGLVRLTVPRERWEFRDASNDWQPDDRLGWRQKGNYSTTNYDLGTQPVVFSTNEDGFRPAAIHSKQIDSSDFVILLVGNSTVNGRSVPEDQTLHARLDSLMKASGKRTVVVNASVQGYSTDQSLLMVAAYCRQYQADWVLYGFCDNDLGGNVLGTAYGLAKPRFEYVRDSLVLHAPPHTNSDLSAFRQSSWKDLIVKSALFRVVRPLVLTMRAQKADAATQILIGAYGADYYFEPTRLEVFDWKLMGELIRAMKRASNDNGARFAFYAHPAVESVWRPHIEAAEKKFGKEIHPFVIEEKLSELVARDSIAFIPMARMFLTQQARGPFHLLPNDTHCNGAGYQLQAEIISSFLLEREQQ
jgi:hypothetical protein